ncbi:unnamed protein product [Sphagnum tenellum]
MCRNWGQPPTESTVTYDALRYSLEKFGFYCSDKEFVKIIHYADPFNIGSVRLELDVPRPLGFDVGYWGAPAALGQGTLVLEPAARNARSTVPWSENEQVYSPLTGLPILRRLNQILPLHKGTNGKGLGERYSYGEVKAKLDKDEQRKGQQQYEYFPTSQAPMKKLDVMPPSMPIRQVLLASADQVLRPSACQKPSDQSAKLAVLQTAKEMGAIVRNAPDFRDRVYSKYPPLYTYVYIY